MAIYTTEKKGCDHQSWEYCDKSKRISLCSSDECLGKILVKGDGFGENDNYGQDYIRDCPLANACQKRI